MALRALLVALVLGAAVAFAALGAPAPAPLPATAAPGDFSAERAMHELAAVAAQPHPTGTAAASEVRAYIVRRLEELGFEVQVQDATALTEAYAAKWGAPVVAAHVRNVIARRRGREVGPGPMLMAHYDSRELAPGASDDGYGTAALLETARALAASPPLRHDVWLLFTEGEEQGLLGAKAFVEESPLASQAAVAINLEARGDRGPALMFQTSQAAAGLIDVLAHAAPHVMASSLSQEVYRRMPNDTDLTLWLRAGYPGLNVANVDGFGRYHQSTDTLANADPATLQHHGSYALSLARAFADRAVVAPAAAGDSVYFSMGGLFVHYPAREAMTLAGFAVGLLAIAVAVGLWRGRLRAPGILAGAGVAVAAVALAGIAAEGAWWALARASGDALGMQTVRDVVRKICIGGLMLLGAGVAWTVLVLARRWIRTADLSVGSIIPCAVLAVASGVGLPGGSYLFAWPLAAAGAAWCFFIARSHPRRGERPEDAARRSLIRAVPVLLVVPVVAIVLVVPVGLQLGLAFGPAAAPALAAIGALVATSGAPLVDVLAGNRPAAAAAALLGGAIGALVAALALPSFDARFPRPDSLVYALDAEGHTWWLSFDESADEWTTRALAGGRRAPSTPFFPRTHRNLLQGPAPATPIEQPTVEMLSDALVGSGRTLRLRLHLPPGTEIAGLQVPPDAHVKSASVQGRSFSAEPSDGWIDLGFFGPPDDGLDVVLVTTAVTPVRVVALAQTRGLPPAAAAPLGPRPADRMPEVGWNPLYASDMTLAVAAFEL
jgi:hypothetical protein